MSFERCFVIHRKHSPGLYGFNLNNHFLSQRIFQMCELFGAKGCSVLMSVVQVKGRYVDIFSLIFSEVIVKDYTGTEKVEFRSSLHHLAHTLECYVSISVCKCLWSSN